MSTPKIGNIPYAHRVIRASAGTGKTHALTGRYIDLLVGNQLPDRVLATTFTRKAAREIQARVFERLAGAALGDKKALKHLRGFTPQKASALLSVLTRSIHRLNIGTLDSFFMRIATAFAMELGLPMGWRILDETGDAVLRHEAISAVLSEESPQRVIDLIRLLNPGLHGRSVHDQIARTVGNYYKVFVEQPDRDAWDQLDPPRTLAPDALAAAVAAFAALPDVSNGNVRGTVTKDKKRVDDGDWETFIMSGLARAVDMGLEKYWSWIITEPVATVYKPLVTHAKGMVLGALQRKTLATHTLLDAFDRRYRRLKFTTRGLTFDDVTMGLARGAAQGRLNDVYFRLDAVIDHLLLDEFQDTSIPQWRVVEPLASEVAATGGRSIFCVGDVKQAIYGWRGGVAEVFGLVERMTPGTPVESKDHTYRCRRAIVDTVNRVFEDLPALDALREKATPAAHIWSEGFRPHSFEHHDVPGYVRVLVAPRAEGPATQWATTLAHGARIVADLVRRGPDRSIGVLVRTNKAVARVIFELQRLGVPASEEGGNPLTDSPGVSIVLSLLRLSDHPGDTAARFHVARSPLGLAVGLTDHTDEAMARTIASRIRRALVDDGYGPTVFVWAESLAASCDARSLERLIQLVDLAYRYDAAATLRPTDFVNHVESEKIADPASEQVRVMTVHGAKGLEFDTVVLPELDKDLAGLGGGGGGVLTDRPSAVDPPRAVVLDANEKIRALDPDLVHMADQRAAAAVVESLSVLYVMMTRPKFALHAVIAPSTETEKNMPAKFSGILRGALCGPERVEPGQTVYEAGEPNWESHAPKDEPLPTPVALRPVERRFPAAPNRTRHRPRTAPSGLEGGARIDLKLRLQLGTHAAKSRGSRVHALLQDVEWVESAGAAHDGLRDILAQPNTRRIFSRATYAGRGEVEVRSEEPFLIGDDAGIMCGTIDRLLIFRADGGILGAEVIDFKTDQIDDKGVPGRVEFYRPQIEAYRKAVSMLLGIEHNAVSAKLVFLTPDHVCEL